MQPTTLISTVGASLIANLTLLEQKGSEVSEQERGLVEAYKAKQWKKLARLLGMMEPTDRTCGAEINTIHELIHQRSLVSDNAHLYFCLSETTEGRQMKTLLELFYESQGRRVTCNIIEGLQDQDENIFRRTGLRCLVQKIAKIVRECGGTQWVAFNATGGYKAQIALSAIIGQALGITVYYKHEKFPGVIALPPMPVAFDFDLFGQEADVLLELEERDQIELAEEVSEALHPLVEEVEIDGKHYASLSAMGQLYLEAFRLRYPQEKTLPSNPPTAERRKPTFRDDHYPDGFKEYVNKIWHETPFMTTCHTLPYDKQRGIRSRIFYIRPIDGEVIGEYRDHDNFGARFAVMTSASTQAQKLAVIDYLMQRYGHNQN